MVADISGRILTVKMVGPKAEVEGAEGNPGDVCQKPCVIRMNPAPMTEEAHDTANRPRRSLARRVFAFLSGYCLATLLLVLTGVLTWLATLEQVDSGLYATLNKYFDWRSFYLFPGSGRRMIWIPLPGGYWVCVLLFVNLLLGGILRARKGWKQAGILMAHSGIPLARGRRGGAVVLPAWQSGCLGRKDLQCGGGSL